MSWLSDIAGRAEDLLNKVDKTTAVVLQNKQANIASSSVSYNLSQTSAIPSSAQSRSGYGPAYSRVPSRQTVPDKSIKSNSSFKRGPVSDDEKLLEFLNSNEPALPELRKKNQQRKEGKHADDTAERNKSIRSKQITRETSAKKLDGDAVDGSTHNAGGDSESKGASGKETVIQAEAESDAGPSIDVHEHHESAESPVPENWESSSDYAVETSHSEAEFQDNQMQYEQQGFQTFEDRNVRELLEREADLTAALDAKDSQLAVLKVRLEEADEEIKNKTNILEELKSENERLLRDYNDGLSSHSQIIENLRQQLAEAEAEVKRTKEEYHSVQNEHLSQMNKVDEEKRQLAENITTLQKRISELSDRSRESSFLLSSANRNLENLQHEYNDYKQRAQRILQSKEKLISSLKEGRLDTSKAPSNETNYAVLSAETEGIKQERDLLREELRKAMDSIETYRTEIHELEKMAQNDADAAREHCRNLEEQLQQERMLKDEVQHLNNRLKEEISFLQEEIVRTKSSFSSRIEDREMEIEKLRKQLMAKSLSTVSQDELESRLHALTENLIQKQTIVEALSTEKNSLTLQLERLEQQLKEAQMYGMQHHAVIGVSSNETERKPKPSLFIDNPLDSNLTRNVKRVYGSIDAFSIRLGVFFRRYPVARLFVFIYMFILHVWVMVVLLTYEPEVHGPSYKPDGKK